MIVGRRNPVSSKQRIFRRRFQTTAFNARISRLQPTDVRWSMVFQFVNPTLPQALWLAYRLCVGVYKSVWMTKAIRIENQSCKLLEANPSCGFMSSECAETNDKGECIHFTDTYDCGFQTSDLKCVVSILCRVVLRPVSRLRRSRHLLKPRMYRITRCARRSARLLSVS